jgi:hypothetical protein
MDKTVLPGLGRYLLSWAGIWLISKGYVTADAFATISDSLSAIGAVLLTAGPPLYWAVIGAKKAKQ